MALMKKPWITLVVIAIVTIVLASVGPVVYKAVTDRGTKTESLTDGDAKAASTNINGSWKIVRGSGKNATSAGYTFHEILPGKSKETSGSTNKVDGSFTVSDQKLTEGSATTDLTSISSDVEKRDINVRRTILDTDEFPKAVFTIKGPVDVSSLPGDGHADENTVPGTMEIHGVKKDIDVKLKALRTGKKLIVSSTIPINRRDYDIESPQFVAAKIDETGEINLLLTMEKQ